MGEQYGIDYPRFSNDFLQMTTADPSYKYNRLNYCWSAEKFTSNRL